MRRALAPILAALDRTSHERAAVRNDFAGTVLRRVPAAQLESVDPDTVARALADSFEFVDGRDPNEIAVRLIDPEVALDGTPPTGTILEVSCDDRQFIVSTVKEELHQLGQRVARMLHPVFGSERTADGRLAAILPARDAAHRDSFLQVELGSRFPAGARRALVEAIKGVVGDVFAATDDFAAMREQVAEVAARTRQHAGRRYAEDEVTEAADLLDWLLDDNFVLLATIRGDERLGVRLRQPVAVAPALDGDVGGADVGGDRPDRPLLRLTHTAETSTVHRQVPMHRIEVVEVGPDGRVDGLFHVVGVFSDKANAEPAVVTPVLRWKLRRILELEDVVPGSHDEAALVSLFQVLPKEELFDSSLAVLRQTIVGLLAAEDQQDVRVRLRVEPASRAVSALLSIPQELYSSALRHRVERFLMAQLDGAWVDAQVALGDRAEAILRLIVHIDGPLPVGGLDSLEREVRLLCRTWDQELAGALASRFGEARGRQLAQVYADRFPTGYRSAVLAEQAVDDVVELDRLLTTGDGIGIRITPDTQGEAEARFKVFVAGPAIELSSLLPIIESLGLWAVEEEPWTLGSGDSAVHLHDFGVRSTTLLDGGASLDIERDGTRLADAARALWHGRAEVDPLNRLVLHAGMPWRDVAVLRAYRRYRSQVGTTFSTGYVDDVLVENASVSRSIVDLFAARFDPAAVESVEAVRARIQDRCDAVPRLDHDRILRGLLALVDATVRTNRYTTAGDHLALKIASAAVPDMPRPVPFREIFVHGPAVEGVHLRWGPVARGGVRWSDRPDDYRSEVLGLMRAQVLKNAVIVPTGAKGGFIVKRGRYGPPAGAEAVPRAYETFISSLLEVTEGDDDSYLVVAADRGTAKFSDLANRVSEEHGFWLGDAFASGGSRGYDHKALGITARGAWVAVRHHFYELGIDLDADGVTVAGIGDMSGDVFGNAMLQSDRIRLVAAFDHRHIFLDPTPDPAVSYKERARLFALPLSSWDDYDRARISAGGGVWSRLHKRIELSAEAREALGVSADHLTPPELIRAILQAPVGLLFAGGIGTFVRASSEPDQDIDDRANTEVRVDGLHVRARVVGEGANLAFTQRARIEYARRGGRINTDAIDNSAAVDISDREVNLKILLRAAVDAGEITMDERDHVLTDVCEDVVAAVLDDCLQQSLALSRAQQTSPRAMDATEALLVELEGSGVLDRAIEALPSTDEMRARAQAGAGLTRPELAVLLAGAKRRLAAEVLASDIPDQPALRVALERYFPPAIRARFDHLLDGHRLRRELIAAVVANDLVNRMGATFVSRVATETGATPERVVTAYCIAWGVARAGEHWDYAAAAEVSTLLEALTRDYLRRGETDIAATVVRDRPIFAELEAAMPEIGSAARRRRRTRRAEALVDSGVDPGVAVNWACVEELELAPDIAALVRQTGRPARDVADAFLRAGESLGLDRLIEVLRKTPVPDHWARAAWQGLFDDLDELRREAAHRAFLEHPDRDAAEAVARFLAARAPAVHEALALVRAIEGEPSARLDAVAVAARAVSRGISASSPPLS